MGYFVVSSHKWVQGDVQPSSYSEVPNLVGWGSNKWTSRLFSAVKQLAHNLKFMHTFTVFCFYLQMLYLRREEDPRLWPDRIKSALQTALKLAQMCKKKNIHICPHAQWERQSSNRTHQNTTAKKKAALCLSWPETETRLTLITGFAHKSSQSAKTWARPRIMITHPFISIISVLWIRLNNSSHCWSRYRASTT